MNCDFRFYIKEEFERRVLRNCAYSLRAFARDLGVPVSKLSEMLNSKQGISSAYAKKIAAHLKLKAADERIFFASVEVQLSRTPTAKHRALRALNAAVFEASVHHTDSDLTPFHFAVKCLLEIFTESAQVAKIAARLNVDSDGVLRLLEDLLRAGQVSKSDEGLWEIVQVNTRQIVTKESSKTQHARMLAYRQMFYDLVLKEISSIGADPDVRLLSNVLLNVPTSELPRLKEMINQAKADLLRFCEKHPKTDDLYCLSISFLPFPGQRNTP